ncbi:sugar ABC transporter permease [Jiangella aurantiaca]|uniref:Sugar ABC transporter permease n=1 Tax=Jiangella aurantiaca TaxID=2530373 RepID=A0A4V2YT97_9ACTN|nr:ABC transporter permease subunit [Jiangella aurantiaca]TDD72967.1 sugar ABC transporter permease [Jiangella aurantiaca]
MSAAPAPSPPRAVTASAPATHDAAGPPSRWVRLRRSRWWRHRAAYLMLLPGLVWFAIYKYAPMYGVVIAFKDYNLGLGIVGSPWADPWYKYFEQFFSSPYFVPLLRNTFLISIYKIIWGTIPPLLLALLLNECRRTWLRRWVQTLSYMPHFLSWVIVFGITVAFLSQSTGLVNRTLESLGGDPIGFLTSNDWFRSVLVGADAWKDLGWGAIIYLAAMIGIDPQRYEAARVDGASRLQQIWHVTLPGIRTVVILLFVLRLGHILEAGFEQVYIFYNVQVYPVADIIDTWVFRTGLESLNFSLAAAVGLFKAMIGLVLIVVANRLAKRWDGQLW